MPSPGDQLLTVVSVRKLLSWNAFRDAFDMIHMGALSAGAGAGAGVNQPVDLLRLRTLRCFSELGHAEPLPISSSSTIAVAPTALAKLPLRGLPSAVFVGARPMDTAIRLRRACSSFGGNALTIVDAQHSNHAYAPAFMGMQAFDDDTLKAVAEDLGIPYISSPPAWNLLHTSASVPEYEASLEWNSDRDPDWLKKVFDPDGLAFRSRDEPAEFQLSAFTHPVTRRTVHRIRYGNRAAIVDRDWGRWLLLHKLGIYVLHYDPELQRIGVPTTVPLPYLLARSLSLFTGRTSDFVHPAGDPSAGMDVYCNIPVEAAEYLSAQLSQQLITGPIPLA